MRKEDYSDLINLYTRRLVHSLGEKLTAVIISGSLATGELVPGESDLDIIIILSSENYMNVDKFEMALTTISKIHEEMVKKYPSLSWHGPRIYNEEVYPLIDHDHNPTNKIFYKRSDFMPESFMARKDFCIRMTMHRVIPGSRGCAFYFDPQQPRELWGWLRFHFLTTALNFFTMKGHPTSKRRVLADIERFWPSMPLMERACRILKDPGKREAPSQDDFWTIVEAIEEIAQKIFNEAHD